MAENENYLSLFDYPIQSKTVVRNFWHIRISLETTIHPNVINNNIITNYNNDKNILKLQKIIT